MINLHIVHNSFQKQQIFHNFIFASEKLKKMRPFVKIHRFLIWLCMYPTDKSFNVWQKVACISFTVVVFIINLCCFATCSAYILKYYSIDVNGSILAFTTVVCEIGIAYVMIVTILMRQKMVKNFENLSQIYTDCKCQLIELIEFNSKILTFQRHLLKHLDENEPSFCFLIEANNTIEWIWKIYFKMMAIVVINFGGLSLISLLIFWLFMDDLSVENFFHIVDIM